MSEASERLTGSTWDVEHLLADALRPIEPPERLSGRVEDTLSAVTQAAAEELSDWAEELSESELRALRDPRNWVRPVVAVGAGGRRHRAPWSCSSCAGARRQQAERSQPPRPQPGQRHQVAGARRDSPAPASRLASSGDCRPPPIPWPRLATDIPNRETARLLLLLRPADLPRLHDADAGRDALPGVHASSAPG